MQRLGKALPNEGRLPRSTELVEPLLSRMMKQVRQRRQLNA